MPSRVRPPRHATKPTRSSATGCASDKWVRISKRSAAVIFICTVIPAALAGGPGRFVRDAGWRLLLAKTTYAIRGREYDVPSSCFHDWLGPIETIGLRI